MARVLSSYALGSEVVRRQKAFTKDDFIKARTIFRILFLAGFVACLSLFYIWSRVQVVQVGYEINALNSRQKELQEEQKRLMVEVATLKSPQRLEVIAAGALKMQPPKPEQIRRLSSP